MGCEISDFVRFHILDEKKYLYCQMLKYLKTKYLKCEKQENIQIQHFLNLSNELKK